MAIYIFSHLGNIVRYASEKDREGEGKGGEGEEYKGRQGEKKGIGDRGREVKKMRKIGRTGREKEGEENLSPALFWLP